MSLFELDEPSQTVKVFVPPKPPPSTRIHDVLEEALKTHRFSASAYNKPLKVVIDDQLQLS